MRERLTGEGALRSTTNTPRGWELASLSLVAQRSVRPAAVRLRRTQLQAVTAAVAPTTVYTQHLAVLNIIINTIRDTAPAAF